jgi:hypothetical protein
MTDLWGHDQHLFDNFYAFVSRVTAHSYAQIGDRFLRGIQFNRTFTVPLILTLCRDEIDHSWVTEGNIGMYVLRLS